MLTACITATAAGCADEYALANVEGRSSVRLSAAQSGQMVRLQEYRLLAVYLPANAENGPWRLTTAPERSIIRLAAHRTPDGNATPPNGPPGEVFYFRAVRPGITSFVIERGPSERFEASVEVFY